MSKAYEFTYKGEEPDRLDRILFEYVSQDIELAGISRSQLKIWIKEGVVNVNNSPATKAGHTVKPDSRVSFDSLFQPGLELEPYDFPLDVIYEDQELLVINKPVGLVVHPGAGNFDETLVNALCAKSLIQADNWPDAKRIGIVHRIDKDTSGLLVVAKDLKSHAALAKQFEAHTVGRNYLALVLSTPRDKRVFDKGDTGRIETRIGRDPKRRTAMTVVAEGGKSAITNWEVLERMPYANLMKFCLETGRTHQIRVHAAHLDAPLIGDPLYGNFDPLSNELKKLSSAFGRQALHAETLAFTHPTQNKRLEFKVDAPDDFKSLVAKFRAVR